MISWPRGSRFGCSRWSISGVARARSWRRRSASRDPMLPSCSHRVIGRARSPRSITVAPWTEFMSRAPRGLGLPSGHPTRLHPAGQASGETQHIESFNGRLRDECLNVQQFFSLADAKAKMEERGELTIITGDPMAPSGT